MMGNKLIRFFIGVVPSKLKFGRDIPYGIAMLQLLLYSAIVRRWLAEWIIEKLANEVKPTEQKEMTLALTNWLNNLHRVTSPDLRRLILALFYIWSRFTNYDGETFTTEPDYTDDYYKKTPFETTMIYSIYHALSNYQPIYGMKDVEEQMNGLLERDDSYIHRIVSYIIGQQKLKLELKIEQT